MRIMGIDPGIATVGFGVIDSEKNKLRLVSTGVIETPAHTSLSSRLDQIYDDTQELIRTFSPDVVSVEELFFKKNITTGIAVAHGRGVLLLACYKSGVQIFEYTPMQVKQAVVGYGLAEKKQVIYMVTSILGMKTPPKPDDAADALALAICHARSTTSLIYKNGGDDPCSTT